MSVACFARITLAGGSCGVLYWLAMPGVGLGPLAFAAFLPLYCFTPERAKASLAAGFLAGVVATLGVCAWLPAATQRMLGVSVWVGAAALAALCIWHGALFALAALLNHRARMQGVPGWLRLPLSLVAAELFLPLPFPCSFAVTQHAYPTLLQIADLGGRLAIVFVIGAATAALGDALQLLRGSAATRVSWASVACGVAPLLVGVAYAALRTPRIDQRVEAASKLRVGLVQPNVLPWVKRANPEYSFNEHAALTRELLAGEPALDLAVWSETAASMPLAEPQLSSALRRRFGKPFRTPVMLGGAIARELGASGTPRTNSVLLSTGDGYVCPRCRYDKQSLMPVAESASIAAAETARFDVGSRNQVLPFDESHGIAALICFEAIFPERVRQLVKRGRARLLVNPSNDGWFGDTGEPELHLALSKLRAVEHRLFLVRVAGTGVSAVIDPVGRTALRIPAFVREARAATVAWLDADTYYDALGDRPWWLLSAAIVCAGSRRLRTLRLGRSLNGKTQSTRLGAPAP